ncbi:hypothetical protein KM043_007271 [Ampulex compressa]|nr:hypothetical protein KM043_007271 [Ampulex compressa]
MVTSDWQSPRIDRRVSTWAAVVRRASAPRGSPSVRDLDRALAPHLAETDGGVTYLQESREEVRPGRAGSVKISADERPGTTAMHAMSSGERHDPDYSAVVVHNASNELDSPTAARGRTRNIVELSR